MHHDKRGIYIEWDDAEQTIIRWDFYRWTWKDFHAAAMQVEAMFVAANKPFYVPSILNLKHSGSIPIGAFPHFSMAIDMMETDGWTVITEASGFARMLAVVFMRFNPKARGKVYFADTLEDARALIAQRRQRET
jgi:hypothetical protein